MWTILKDGGIKAKQVIIIIILLAISGLTYMAIPSFLGSMIDNGVSNNQFNSVIGNAIGMVVSAAIMLVSFVIAIKVIGRLVTDFSDTLRVKVFDKVLSFSAKEIDKFGTSNLITRSTADVSNIQNFVSYALATGLLAPLMFIAAIILVSRKAGKLTIVLLIAIPIILVVIAVVLVSTIRNQDKLKDKLDDLNKIFLENLQGVRVIRAFNRQHHEKNRFKKENDLSSKLLFKATHVSGIFKPATQLIFGVTTVALMICGSIMVMNSTIEVGDLVSVNEYVTSLLSSIIMFTFIVNMFPKFYICSKRVEAVLKTQPSISEGDKTVKDKTKKSSVEFKDVTFSYSNADTAVLNNINFKATTGQTVAIIGKTGCGKSSLLKLIPRLYDTTFGQVCVDGINVRDYKKDDLNSLIGYVPQKSVLFKGDVAYNLNFADENATEKDWEWACKVACANEFIMEKENGYRSEISQGGKNLSGGQRQRMAIARALMKRPEILIFDDSFSALDLKTDKTLRANLKRELKDTLIIMAAQRISTIIDADLILVLDDNKVVGQGTHSELLQTCKLYKEIVELQTKGDL